MDETKELTDVETNNDTQTGEDAQKDDSEITVEKLLSIDESPKQDFDHVGDGNTGLEIIKYNEKR